MIFRKVAEIGKYKKMCAVDSDSAVESDSDEKDGKKPDEKDDKPSGIAAGVCEGKKRNDCKRAKDTCSWVGAEKKCRAARSKPDSGAKGGKEQPEVKVGTFASFKKICSSSKDMCKACGGKLKKKKCVLKAKKIKCSKLKDESLCKSVPGCSLKKKSR